MQRLQTSYVYMSLLSLSTPSVCPLCGPVFGGKGVRFTSSEDVYPDKGMWHSGTGPETTRTNRKPPEQSPTPSTLHPHHMHPETPLPAQTHPKNKFNAQIEHSSSVFFFLYLLHPPLLHPHILLHTCPPQQEERRLYAFMHVVYTLMSVCMETALNTYAIDSMYEQTVKHDVWTSEKKNRNALKCGGILIQHDVRGLRVVCVCECVCVCTRGQEGERVTEQSQCD